ncbi:MAG TPA: helix-turn-helix domain-containing protein, partial [Chitinophagaceae bacterium]|nr:helix-turn-helix domain-containing protein [Chitinophagaceae bacterium]
QKFTLFLKNEKVNARDICGFYHVPYPRQQIADFIGLRVETVIRTLVRMSREGKITIDNHKLYY